MVGSSTGSPADFARETADSAAAGSAVGTWFPSALSARAPSGRGVRPGARDLPRGGFVAVWARSTALAAGGAACPRGRRAGRAQKAEGSPFAA